MCDCTPMNVVLRGTTNSFDAKVVPTMYGRMSVQLAGFYSNVVDPSVEIRLKWGGSYNSYDSSTSQPSTTIAIMP
eukprot:35514-Eustigmatos_ZCMA.PRE.1